MLDIEEDISLVKLVKWSRNEEPCEEHVAGFKKPKNYSTSWQTAF